MWRALITFPLVVLLFPTTLSQAFIQESNTDREINVPCRQTFEDFTKNFDVDCTSPCEVLCHGRCHETYSAETITGYLYYTASTPICYAALFQGTTVIKIGGSFAIRASGEMPGFVSGTSLMGEEERSQSSTTPQPGWFIEPYERVRFIQEPEDTTVRLGKYLTLTCQVNSRSRARITWYNNDREVSWSTTVDCAGEVCMIQHAEKSHAGTWWCKVDTEYSGTLVSRHVTVTVAYLNTTFIYQPRDSARAYSGDSGSLKMLPDSRWPLVLPCSVDSQPPALITWYKNNRPLLERHVFQVQDGSLYFLTVDDKDSGSYKCSALNTVTNETVTSNTKRIQRDMQATRPGPVPSSIISSIAASSVYASPGDTVTLRCVAKGNPIPTISWNVPGPVATSGRNSSPFFGRKYIITNVRKSDTGEYKCSALNDNDYMIGASFIFKVIVVTAPTFSIVPRDQTISQGDQAVLSCGLQNRGSLDWLKDGTQVNLSPSVQMNGDNLVIEDVSAVNVGMYQCVTGYMFGDNRYVRQSSAYLSVWSEPKITITNKEDMIHEGGQSIRIRCTASGYPYPYVTWFKDGMPLVFDDRIRMMDIQSIMIDNADGLDYGDYTCVARNSLNTANLTRTLNVIVKAKIVSLEASDERGYYLSGDKILITCVAAGSKDLDITWSKDNDQDLGTGVVVKEENDVELYDYVITRSVLEIPVSYAHHEGTYRCLARNYLGRHNKDLAIRVYPEAIPPRLESGPINTVISFENNMLVQCQFSGAPPPWVTWRKDGQIVQSIPSRIVLFPSEDGLTSNLMITDAVKSDSGNYSCEGSNSAGYTVKGLLPIQIHYSDTGGVRNGTNSTRGLIFALPVLFLWLLFV